MSVIEIVFPGFYGWKRSEDEDSAVFVIDRLKGVGYVIQSCDIRGSSDSSIRNVKPTDIRKILETSDIKQIYANGNKAGALYKKYQLPLTGMEAITLPSTSPANAAWSFERLCEAWTRILANL